MSDSDDSDDYYRFVPLSPWNSQRFRDGVTRLARDKEKNEEKICTRFARCFKSVSKGSFEDAKWMIEERMLDVEKKEIRHRLGGLIYRPSWPWDPPVTKFLLDNELVSEEKIRKSIKRAEFFYQWDRATMLETNKKGSSLKDLCRAAIRRPSGPCGEKNDRRLHFDMRISRRIDANIDNLPNVPKVIKKFLKYQ